MKSYDILSDNMEICRPPFFHLTETNCDIIKECIIPYIGHLSRIKWKWYTKLIGLTRYRKIIKSCFYKFFDFSIATMWSDKVRMSLIEIEKSILIF